MDRFSYENIQLIEQAIYEGIKGDSLYSRHFHNSLESIKELERKLVLNKPYNNEKMIYIAAYYMNRGTDFLFALSNTQDKLKKMGFSDEEIAELGTHESIKIDRGLVEQRKKVKEGIVKTAYKKEITPELVYKLYKELGSQQAVADKLGISIKTVRDRLKKKMEMERKLISTKLDL